MSNKDSDKVLELLPSLQNHNKILCKLTNELLLRCLAKYTHDQDSTYLLHISALYGWLTIVNKLVTEYNCSPLQKDGLNCIALHYAAMEGHLPVVKYFVTKCNCDANIVDIEGDTPLHYAALNGHLSVVQYFINDCNCGTDAMAIRNEYENTALHLAALNGHLSVVQFFINDCNCDTMLTNKHGSTLLHLAALNGHLSVVEYFINVCKHNAKVTNNDNATPLHCAAESGHLETVQYFINVCKCDAKATNKLGSMPLHVAAFYGHLSVVQYFINDCKINAMAVNAHRCTPLHLAALEGHLSVVQYFVKDCNCDVILMSKDIHGATPLHDAAEKGHLSVVEYLVNDCKCDPMAIDGKGSTPLQRACQNNCIPVMQYLFSIPAVLNSFSIESEYVFPMSSSSSVDDAKVLYEKFEQIRTSHPVGSFVNILVLGNAGAGKTTLCQVIKERLGLHITTEERVRAPCTVGIVPTKFHESDLGNIIVHDFAGQLEYYSSHAVLENLLQNCGAVFVVLINLTQDLLQQVRLWLNIFRMERQKLTSECHLIIVGSHADKITQLSCLPGKLLSYLAGYIPKELDTVPARFYLDCRLLSGCNLELNTFFYRLSNLCASIRKKQNLAISLYCNFLYSLLKAKVSENNVCTLHQLIDLCDKSRQEGVPLPDDIVPSLKTLHSTGLIMYLENKEDILKSWIVVNKEILLTDVNSMLFAPASFTEHATNTGIITTNALHQLFPHYSVDMLIIFLKSMKFVKNLMRPY